MTTTQVVCSSMRWFPPGPTAPRNSPSCCIHCTQWYSIAIQHITSDQIYHTSVHTPQHNTTLHFTPSHIVQHHITSHHNTPHHFISHHIIPHHITPSRTFSHSFFLSFNHPQPSPQPCSNTRSLHAYHFPILFRVCSGRPHPVSLPLHLLS